MGHRSGHQLGLYESSGQKYKKNYNCLAHRVYLDQWCLHKAMETLNVNKYQHLLANTGTLKTKRRCSFDYFGVPATSFTGAMICVQQDRNLEDRKSNK